MKIVAVLEIDENKLKEVDVKAEREIGWYIGPGVIMQAHKIVEETGDCEYAAFVWNKSAREYEQVGRSVGSAMLAINRYQAYAKNGWFCRDYDTNKVVFKRRLVSAFFGEWEAIDCEN